MVGLLDRRAELIWWLNALIELAAAESRELSPQERLELSEGLMAIHDINQALFDLDPMSAMKLPADAGVSPVEWVRIQADLMSAS